MCVIYITLTIHFALLGLKSADCSEGKLKNGFKDSCIYKLIFLLQNE